MSRITKLAEFCNFRGMDSNFSYALYLHVQCPCTFLAIGCFLLLILATMTVSGGIIDSAPWRSGTSTALVGIFLAG